MKKVMDKYNVAHMWANQLQDEARTSTRNLYFNGATIYSYGSHFPIASHIEFNGKEAVLFTTRDYSVTTSQHKFIVYRAIPGGRLILFCHNVENWSHWPEKTFHHNGNFDAWKTELENLHQKLVKARKKEKYTNEIARVKLSAEKYCDFFEVSIPDELQKLFNTDSEEIRKYFFEKAEKIIAEEKARKEKEKQIFLENVEKFKNFEIDHLYKNWFIGDDVHDYLRFNKEKQIVETSQRVEVPLRLALCFHALIENKKLTVGMHLLSYSVKKVDEEEIVIGCHKFPTDYLLNFGNELKTQI